MVLLIFLLYIFPCFDLLEQIHRIEITVRRNIYKKYYIDKLLSPEIQSSLDICTLKSFDSQVPYIKYICMQPTHIF